MTTKKQAEPPRSRPKKSNRATAARTANRKTKPRVSDRAARRLIVGIGASAGGLEALTQLLQHLPTDTGLAFVVVQHLDPVRESALTGLLSKATSLPVREVANDLPVQPNHIYVIPPNTSLTIANAVLKLQPRQATAGAHRSIDFFFESLAQDQHDRAIGVVLSGAASDGTLGLEAIKGEGGITFAQDESAKYDSMPRSAIAAGCVDFVLSPENIANELAHIARHPYVVAGAHPPAEDVEQAQAPETPQPARGRGRPRDEAKAARGDGKEDGYKKILALLRNHSDVDFSLYKTSTIQRRIQRRMVLNRLTTFDAYAQFLRDKGQELDALYSDVLINVTSFFRNAEAFEFLKRKVFTKILPDRRDEPLRVWVLACSSGQEAYSLAMALMEFFDNIPRAPKLQIFASDLNEALLAKARAGLYAKSVVLDVSPERLRRFFVEDEGGYRVIKPLREAVVFARQNILSDPPFSRMDLISCRNLLIYLEPSLHKKVLPTLHYALKPKGCLFLGASETIGAFTDLFEPVDKQHKIYFKKQGPMPPVHRAPAQASLGAPPPYPMGRGHGERTPEGFRLEINAQREADRVTRSRYAPPSVLVNSELHVVEFRGDTGPYLKPPTGQAKFNVLKMAREGLMLQLRAAFDKAKKENKVVRRDNVMVNQNGQTRRAHFEVVPLRNLKERCYLLFFEEAEEAARAVPSAPPPKPTGPPGGLRTARTTSKKEESRRLTDLERELSETRDYLQSVQEQNEAANEELQASNEEVTSANEELQSINEELETSKEELESANEELTTVNEEMANRNAELSRLNTDLINLQTSVHLAIVLFGRDLTIRRFSAQAEKQFNLLATDVGRPISHVRHNLDVSDLEIFITEVIDTEREREREVQDSDGRWYSLRVRPYFTLDNKVDGAVLVLVNIDALKQTQRLIAEARDYAESIVETVREPLLMLDSELRIESANFSFYRDFRVTPSETVGRLIYDLGIRQWDIPRLRALLGEILPQNTRMEDFEVERDFEQLGRRSMLLNARRIHGPVGGTQRILLAIEDITERQQHQQELQRAHLAEAIIATARDPVLILDADLRVHAANEAFYKTFKVAPAETVSRLIYELGNCHWDIPRLRQLLEGIIPRNSFFNDLEVTCEIEKVGRRTFLLYARPLKDADKDAKRILVGIQDVTEILTFQAQLRQSETRKDAILKSALDAIITMDHEGKVVEFNPAAEKIFGHSRAKALGRPLAELIIPARLREKHYQGLARYLATGEGPVLNRSIELPALRADGTEFTAELAIVPIPGSHRPMFTAFLRDITERKKAEQVLAEQARLLDLSNDAIIVRDIRDRIIYWNDGAEELYGWPRQEALGKVIHTLLQTEFPKPFEQIMAELHQNNYWSGELAQTKRDGQRIAVLSRWALDQDKEGNPAGVLAINTDITDRKHVEERQHLLLNELAHRGKNLLAVVQSIASRSLSGTRPLTETREVFLQRLKALARSQSVLVTESFQGAPVAEIIRLEFEAFSERVKAVGPDVMLNPRTAQTFALLVHELATNAVKHGALSRPEGQIAIHWSIEGAGAEARFKFRWQEHDGPPVAPPTYQGFGRILLEKAAAQDFGASPKIRFAPEGLSYEIDASLSVMAARGAGESGGFLGDT